MDTNTVFIIFFLLFSVFFAIRRIQETYYHPNKKRGEITKRFSLPVLTGVYVVVSCGAVLELLMIRRNINFFVTSIGIVFYVAAFALRAWSFKTLGEYFSPHIEIRDEQPLIIEGPYRVVRHPIYLGVLVELIGFVIIPNSYYALLLAIFVYMPLLLVRMLQEESAMVGKFGSDYIRYKQQVYALLPLRKYPGKP